MSRRSFVVLLAALAFALALQSWGHVWEVLHESRLNTEFDLDRSNSLPDVLSTIVIAAACGGSALLASRARGRMRHLTGALAGVLVLVAAADFLHFRPGVASVSEAATDITAVAGFVLLTLLVLIDPNVSRRARMTLILGVLALVGSIAVGDLPELNEWFERARGDPIIEWQIVAKQGLELAGWWLVAVALWDGALQPKPSPSTSMPATVGAPV